MTIELIGNWNKGFAHDVHTLDSMYMGVDEYGHHRYKTTRSDMGELVYQLKYCSDRTVIGKIVDMLDKYKGLETMDAIIPIPSTNKNRAIQPVYEIAQELGRRISVPVLENVLITQENGQELKNIDNPDDRKKVLQKQMILTNIHPIATYNILLIDDLYRSGSTLHVATDILYQQAKVKSVSVLIMTKTRSKR